MAEELLAQESTAPEVSRKRRRQFLVNPAFQWKYTISLSVIVFLITICLSSVLYSFLHDQARQRMMNPQSASTSVGVVVIFFSIVFSLLTSVSVGLWCFMVTHRICGPLYVIDRHLRELAQGVIPKLRPLRKKDEFKDFFATFSSTTQALREEKKRTLTGLTELVETAQSAADRDEAACREALSSMTKQLNAMRGEIAEAIGQEVSDTPNTEEARAESREPVAIS